MSSDLTVSSTDQLRPAAVPATPEVNKPGINNHLQTQILASSNLPANVRTDQNNITAEKKDEMGLKLALTQLRTDVSEKHFTLRELICWRIKLLSFFNVFGCRTAEDERKKDMFFKNLIHELIFYYISSSLDHRQSITALKSFIEIAPFNPRVSAVKTINELFNDEYNVENIKFWSSSLKIILNLNNLEDIIDVPLQELLKFKKDEIDPLTGIPVDFWNDLTDFLNIWKGEKQFFGRTYNYYKNEEVQNKIENKKFYNILNILPYCISQILKNEYSSETSEFFLKITNLLPNKLDSKQLSNNIKNLFQNKIFDTSQESIDKKHENLITLIKSDNMNEKCKGLKLIKEEVEEWQRVLKKVTTQAQFTQKYFDLMRLILKLVVHSYIDVQVDILKKLKSLPESERINWINQNVATYINNNLERKIKSDKAKDTLQSYMESSSCLLEMIFQTNMQNYSIMLMGLTSGFIGYWNGLLPSVDKLHQAFKVKPLPESQELPKWLTDEPTEMTKEKQKKTRQTPRHAESFAVSNEEKEVPLEVSKTNELTMAASSNPPEAELKRIPVDSARDNFNKSYEALQKIQANLLTASLPKAEKKAISNYTANAEFHFTLLQGYPNLVHYPETAPFCFEVEAMSSHIFVWSNH